MTDLALCAALATSLRAASLNASAAAITELIGRVRELEALTLSQAERIAVQAELLERRSEA